MSQDVDISITESVSSSDFAAPARAAIEAALPIVREFRPPTENPEFKDRLIEALRPVLGSSTPADAWQLCRMIHAYMEAHLREDAPECDAASWAQSVIEQFVAEAKPASMADVLARMAYIREELKLESIPVRVVHDAVWAFLNDVGNIIAGKGITAHFNQHTSKWNSKFNDWRKPKEDPVALYWEHAPTRSEAVEPSLPAHPDAELLDLARRHTQLNEWFRSTESEYEDEDHKIHFAEFLDVEEKIAAASATTISGIAVKLRVAKMVLLPLIDDSNYSQAHERCLISALADCERWHNQA